MYEIKDGIKGCLVAIAICFCLGLIKTLAFNLYWKGDGFFILLGMLLALAGVVGAIIATVKYAKSDYFEDGGLLGKFGLIYIIVSVIVMLFY